MEAVSIKSTASTNTSLNCRIIYTVQVAVIFILILFSLLNLTIPRLANENLEKLWIGLLGTCVGYLLPNPKLKTPLP